VNRNAAIVKRGISNNHESLVIGPTTTATFSSFPFMNLASLDIESGGLLIFDIRNRFKIVVENLESARRERKLFLKNHEIVQVRLGASFNLFHFNY
jgi:hypothetical protein